MGYSPYFEKGDGELVKMEYSPRFMTNDGELVKMEYSSRFMASKILISFHGKWWWIS